ncbi:S8 family serine peptidase [Deinococcus humi]|uniref:Subtilisin family serine protease n=1 Tax=Deinococcus humi TaxID=662880 RepID=A0A7W8JXU9_9DEIO|nr:S8 family serine peptidase [Deinococcus humi]MBB5364960.1 subtilisin family serine protease [Deinococcus humi]GGO35020.1 hypothetical protein GCM10008949_36740 [Deinococcus humi]
MKHIRYFLPLLTGALLAACGTTPLSTANPSEHGSTLQAQATETPPVMKLAAATGRIGAWATGRIGAWATSRDASTVPGGALNTFSENIAAWNLIHLSEAQALAPQLGKDVIVAVVDTGLDLSHPVFSNRLTAPGTWYDFVGRDTNPTDVRTATSAMYGHGTAVASLILQVAPGARILPIRALNADGEGTVADLAAGVDWAIQQGAQVINVSAVSSVDSDLSLALARAAAQGIYVTLAVGNEGVQRIAYPARNSTMKNVLGQYAVNAGAVNSDRSLASWSNYGSALELTAPGVALATAVPGGNYALVSGTSFATPVLSGTLALALGESYQKAFRGQLALQLNATATDIKSANLALSNGASDVMGNGVVNAQAFLQKVR